MSGFWRQLKKVWGEILSADPAGAAATEGRFYYNDVTKTFRYHDGTSWQDMNAGMMSLPAGVVSPYGGTSAPAGWLVCDGSVVAQATYPSLYGVIVNLYGSDAGGNFTLPDLRSQFVRGANDMGNGASGNGGPVAFPQGDMTAIGPADNTVSVSGGTASGTFASSMHQHFPGTIVGRFGASGTDFGWRTAGGGFTSVGDLASAGGVPGNISTSTSMELAGTSTSNNATASVVNTPASINDGGAVETRPVNLSMIYIIKT